MRSLLLTLSIVFSTAYVVVAQTTNIITVAGGSYGYGGDGGPATAAQLGMPSGLATDTVGNIYIADMANHLIRKVSPLGIITTIAGVPGMDGGAGDGGPATAACLELPMGVALGGAGNIYIVEGGYYRVRKISPEGILTTIAGISAGFSGDGGPATAASFNYPSGIAADSEGNVYIADRNNNRIRKINTAGIISTFAGNGLAGYSGDGGPATAASLNSPSSVTISGSNFYIADRNNNRVRKIAADGTITTVAGAGAAINDGDDGPATAANILTPYCVAIHNGIMYISSEDGNTVRMVNPSGIITTVAGPGGWWSIGDGGPATAGTLGHPRGVAVTTSGNLLIADQYNARIRKLVCAPATGTITGPSDVCPGNIITYTNAEDSGSWSMSAPAIATITGSGILSAVAPGTATITYTVNNSCGIGSTTSAITVLTVPAGTITGPASVCQGAAVPLSVMPGGTWSSSDTSLATVTDAGVVTGVDPGIAVIAYNFTNICGTMADSVAITVNTTPATGILSVPSVICSGTSFTLTSTIVGGTWASSDTAMISILGDVGTPADTGITTLLYTVANAFCTATDSASAYVQTLPFSDSLVGPNLICLGSAFIVGLYPTFGTTAGVWSSTDTAVALVSTSYPGVLVPVSAGTTIISYTTTNACGTVADTQSITVINAPDSVTVTGPSVVCAGSSIMLLASDTGGMWVSTNAGVATITDGVVSGVSAGTAVVIYSIFNTCTIFNITDTITVLDTPAMAIISGPTRVCPDNSIALVAIPATGTWSAGAGSIATINSSGIVTGLTPGTTAISYTTANTCGEKTATWPVTVLPPDSCSTATAVVGNVQGNVLIYPEPNNGTFSIRLPYAAKTSVLVELADMLGKTVYYEKHIMPQTTIAADVHYLPAGNYIARIIIDNQPYHCKLSIE